MGSLEVGSGKSGGWEVGSRKSESKSEKAERFIPETEFNFENYL